MHLPGISQLISRLDAVSELSSEEGASSIFGLLVAARPAVAAALAERVRRPLLVVTAQAHTAQELAEEIGRWSARSVALFPALDALPYERVRLDREVLAQRESVRQDLATGKAEIVIAPA